eukprot:3139344-Pyramimonas_sp.AAC.1
MLLDGPRRKKSAHVRAMPGHCRGRSGAPPGGRGGGEASPGGGGRVRPGGAGPGRLSRGGRSAARRRGSTL